MFSAVCDLFSEELTIFIVCVFIFPKLVLIILQMSCNSKAAVLP